MIKMTIHHGEEVQQRDLPCDFLSLRMSLYQMNLMLAPNEVSVRDVQAEFTSTDPIGQKLISLIRPGDLLSDVDVAIHQLKAAPQAIQEALRQKLMDGSFETIEDIHIGRDQLLEEKCGFRQLYYFPLACSIPDEDGNLEEVSPYILPRYSEQIQDAIEADQKRDIDTMAMYFWTHDQKVNDDWMCVHHDEEGHWRAGIVCDCGWTVYGDPNELVALWNAHSASYPGAESLFDHGGYGSADEWIVDKPAYDEWVCRHCGEPKP